VSAAGAIVGGGDTGSPVRRLPIRSDGGCVARISICEAMAERTEPSTEKGVLGDQTEDGIKSVLPPAPPIGDGVEIMKLKNQGDGVEDLKMKKKVPSEVDDKVEDNRLVVHGSNQVEDEVDSEEEFVFDEEEVAAEVHNRWMAVALYYSSQAYNTKGMFMELSAAWGAQEQVKARLIGEC